MNEREFFDRIWRHLPIDAASGALQFCGQMSESALRVLMELNHVYHTPEERQALMEHDCRRRARENHPRAHGRRTRRPHGTSGGRLNQRKKGRTS